MNPGESRGEGGKDGDEFFEKRRKSQSAVEDSPLRMMDVSFAVRTSLEISFLED